MGGVYCCRGRLIFSTKKLKSHVEWLNQLPSHILSEEAKNCLESGVVYQLGRDVAYRPIIIVDFSKVKNLQNQQKGLVEALSHILVLTREKMLLPHHIERWTMIIDVQNAAVQPSIDGFMKAVCTLVNDNFPKSLEKILMLSSEWRYTPSFSRKGLF